MRKKTDREQFIESITVQPSECVEMVLVSKTYVTSLIADNAKLLADWREQDSILQEIAGLAGDEHVTCAADVLVAVRQALEERRSVDARLTDSESGKADGSATKTSSSLLPAPPGAQP